LSETAVLGSLGGVIGIALAYWGVQVLAALIPAGVPIVNAIRVDHFVLFFALVLSAIASIAFGLAPAFLVANSNLQVNLRDGGARSGESSGGRRAHNILASGEIALAVVLLVAAGLLLRSSAKLPPSILGSTFNTSWRPRSRCHVRSIRLRSSGSLFLTGCFGKCSRSPV